MQRAILALDLATASGWCYGSNPSSLRYGSIRFAAPGASHGEVGSGLMQWLVDFLKVNDVNLVCYEATNVQHMAGKTTIKTIRMLCGIPFLLETVLHRKGIPVREATTRDVRLFFIDANPKRDIAKALTMEKCRELGYQPKNDDEGDAISIWRYQHALLERR